MSNTESIIVGQTKTSSWRKSDTTWTLGLFGTAIGAGVLFFPIRAGFGGLIPILLMLLLAFPQRAFNQIRLSLTPDFSASCSRCYGMDFSFVHQRLQHPQFRIQFFQRLWDHFRRQRLQCRKTIPYPE